MKQGTTVLASFVYDAEGNRVKGTVGGATTVYIAGLYEYSGSAGKSYYTGPDGVVAMRSGSTVYYLLTDHLNSTARIVNSAGTTQSTSYYYPFGGNRGAAFSTLTTRRFTGQYHESSIPGGEGLYYYNARWYDAKLGRFVSADSIVPEPGNPQSFNRYSYVYNNPLKFVDPSGHDPICVCIIVPLIKNVLEDMGLLNPIAPAYMVPVAVGTYQKVREQNTGQEPEPSLEMTTDWYWELGEQSRVLGPDSKITQALMRDEGVSQARQAYMQSGNQDISGDVAYEYVFGLRDAAREFKDVIKRGDWSTSFLGGYDVQVKTISSEGQHTVAEFTVTNVTGWQSATRVWGFSFKQNERRSDPGPGGTIRQTYHWREHIPRQPYSPYNRNIPQ